MSQDDQLLRQLGELAREPGSGAAFDERWERLAAGTLSAEEDAELRRLAETSEEARAAYEAFRPLGGDFQAAVVRAIREQRSARVLPFRRRAARFAGWGAAATAAAAALVLWVWPPTAPLPDYQAKLFGGTQELRGEIAGSAETTQPPPDFAPGDRFQVTVRPATALTQAEPLETRVVLVRGGELRPLDAQAEVDAGGAARVSGSLASDLAAGDWVLWTVIGRPGELPEPEQLRDAAASAPLRDRDWVAVPTALHVRPRAP